MCKRELRLLEFSGRLNNPDNFPGLFLIFLSSVKDVPVVARAATAAAAAAATTAAAPAAVTGRCSKMGGALPYPHLLLQPPQLWPPQRQEQPRPQLAAGQHPLHQSMHLNIHLRRCLSIFFCEGITHISAQLHATAVSACHMLSTAGIGDNQINFSEKIFCGFDIPFLHPRNGLT